MLGIYTVDQLLVLVTGLRLCIRSILYFTTYLTFSGAPKVSINTSPESRHTLSAWR